MRSKNRSVERAIAVVVAAPGRGSRRGLRPILSASAPPARRAHARRGRAPSVAARRRAPSRRGPPARAGRPRRSGAARRDATSRTGAASVSAEPSTSARTSSSVSRAASSPIGSVRDHVVVTGAQQRAPSRARSRVAVRVRLEPRRGAERTQPHRDRLRPPVERRVPRARCGDVHGHRRLRSAYASRRTRSTASACSAVTVARRSPARLAVARRRATTARARRGLRLGRRARRALDARPTPTPARRAACTRSATCQVRTFCGTGTATVTSAKIDLTLDEGVVRDVERLRRRQRRHRRRSASTTRRRSVKAHDAVHRPRPSAASPATREQAGDRATAPYTGGLLAVNDKGTALLPNPKTLKVDADRATARRARSPATARSAAATVTRHASAAPDRSPQASTAPAGRLGGADRVDVAAGRGAQRRLGVEPGAARGDHDREQQVAERVLVRRRRSASSTSSVAARRPRAAARSCSFAASESAGWPSGTPSTADVRPFSAALSPSQRPSSSSALHRRRRRVAEHVRVAADQLVGDAAATSSIDHGVGRRAPARCARGTRPAAAGRRAPRAARRGRRSRSPRPSRRSPRPGR